ncbi:MAG: PorV/PorQ family protein, partial [Candidatus Desantisbacteria bacterium]
MKKLILSIGFGILMAGFAYGIDENAGTSVAPFLKVGASARSAGMGGVSVAISGGADGLYSNPASLAYLGKKEIIFMRHQWLEEVNFNYLAGAFPLEKNQGIGASINLINTGEMKRTTYLKPDGDGTFKTGGMVVTVGYGRINYPILIGASAKYISQKLDDKTGTGIGIDIGTLYQAPIEGLTLGAVVQNINISKIKFIEKEEKLPQVYKVGGGYRIKNCLIGIDISKPQDNSIQFNLGGEYQIHSVFAIRCGYNSSINEGSGLSVGFGTSYLDCYS